MRKQITYIIGFLFLINLLETKAQVIHYNQSIVLLHLPKVHSLKTLISPKALQYYSSRTKTFEKTYYIDIDPLFKDTIGGKVYYFVGVYPETRTREKSYTRGFLEQKSISETLINSLDSSLANQAKCLLIVKTKTRFESDVNIKQNDKNASYYGIDKHYCAYLFKPGPFVLYPAEKTLEIPSNKLFLLEYEQQFFKKRIQFFGTADSAFKKIRETSPVEEKYSAKHWTGNFIEGLANGPGVWSGRATNSYDLFYSNWNIYKGQVEDNKFNGEGIYYNLNGVHAGKWSHGNFISGKSWFTEVNFDTSSYFIRPQFMYGGNLLSDDFAPNCEWFYCKINNPAYERFVIRDTLFPTEMKLNKTFQKSDLQAKSQSIGLIKMAFLLYTEGYSVGGPRFLRSRGSSTPHKNQIFFIVCKNNTSIILKSDVDDQSFRYYDLDDKLVADYKNRSGFIKGLKQACGCN